MRTTQLMLSQGMGGAERYFVDLCLALAARGHPVQAIFHRDFVARGELEGRPNIQCVPVRILAAWDGLARRTIRGQVRDFSPQLMQAHLARGAHIGGQICQDLAIPLTVKTHNLVKLKYYRHVDHFIATTTAQQAYLVAQGVAATRVSIIPNFSALAPVVDAAASHAPLRFCSYGRMVKKKGFDILLHAFHAFLAGGQHGFLQIGGDGVERGALEALATTLGLGEHVEFIGWVADPIPILDDCDVFVLPSLDEPFGIVLLEAMARGKAIIATRTQGPLEMFDDASAWLVNIGDPEDLTRALTDAALHPATVRQKSREALTCFKQTYSADAVVPRILEVYARMLGKAPAAAQVSQDGATNSGST